MGSVDFPLRAVEQTFSDLGQSVALQSAVYSTIATNQCFLFIPPIGTETIECHIFFALSNMFLS